MTAPTPDDLAAIAVNLAVRIRDEPPDANARWLHAQLPDPVDVFRLCFVLAAAIPIDEPWTHLTAWTHTPDHTLRRLRPCGLTPSGHRHRGERVCDDCREYDRARKHAERNPT